MNLAAFTRDVQPLVAANDRRTRRRALLRRLRRAVDLVGIGWSALVVGGFVLWLLPVNMRAA